MIKLSSIVIAYNEAANIKRCIESQLGCIDDIIVLIDDKTTDETEDIIRSFPAVKYEVVKWKGYAGTKQLALSMTSNDWVLWIDADEALTAELKNELMSFKENPPADFSAFRISRRAFFLGRWIKHGGWYPSRATRLFNKNFAKFNDKSVHENIIINGNIGTLKHDLEHHTDPNLKHYFDKFNSYTTLAADELYSNNKRFSVIQLLVRPLYLLFKMYILRLGFLDGIRGFVLAVLSSHYVFVKYAKLWEKEINNRSKK